MYSRNRIFLASICCLGILISAGSVYATEDDSENLKKALENITPEDLTGSNNFAPAPSPDSPLLPSNEEKENKDWASYLTLFLPDVIIIIGAVAGIEMVLYLHRRHKNNH